ncbi:MAG: energy transducer TonB [Bacteroidia bacterium]
MSGTFDKIFSGWVNVTSDFRNELVFADRNKEYGAYQLRKNYNRVYSNALLITVAVFIVGFAIPKLVSVLTPKEDVVANDNTQLDLTPPPVDENEPEPPPPPPPPPPPVQEMVRFIPPVVVDEPIPEDEIPPPQEKLNETQAGTTTQKGDGDIDLPVDLDGDGDKPIEPVKPPEIFTAVQEPPEFVGGEAAMMKYIYENINYPEAAKNNQVEGKIRIKFTVAPDGSIKNAHVISKDKIGFGCEEEAIRVIEGMPKWKPGRQNGNAVHVYFNLPVTFKLF